jgi:hypothetical protein
MIAACLLMADILKLNTPTDRDVRYAPESGHVRCENKCPLCANSGQIAVLAGQFNDGEDG